MSIDHNNVVLQYAILGILMMMMMMMMMIIIIIIIIIKLLGNFIVCTCPRAIPLAMITMRKATHGALLCCFHCQNEFFTLRVKEFILNCFNLGGGGGG